ncbi:MAG: hypothetical protein MJ169_06855 [Treponema sp.]|nr:hypothetical protein [Treponema sp.]
MKKNRKFILTLITSVITLLFAACSSTGGLQELSVNVHPFDILTENASMYLSLPVPQNPDLAVSLLDAMYPNLNDSEKKQLVASLNNVYMAWGTAADKNLIQVTGGVTIPSMGKLLLNSNYRSSSYSVSQIGQAYDAISNVIPSSFRVYDIGDAQLVFPSKKIVAVAKDVKPMVNSYYSEVVSGLLINASGSNRETWKKSAIHNYMTASSNDLRFYIKNPQAFMSNLLANDYSNKIFKLNYCRGSFSKLANGKYSLSVELDFAQSNLVQLAIPVIRLALGLTDFKIVQNSSTNITLSDVQVSTKELLKMLGK